MSIKSLLAIPFARKAQKKVYQWAYKPHKTQQKVLRKLIKKAGLSLWGWGQRSPLDRFYQGGRERTNLEVSDCRLLGRASELQGEAFPML